MCEAVQRTYAGGCSADGVLSTEHERGVAHLHRLLVASLRRGALSVTLARCPRAPHASSRSPRRIAPDQRRLEILDAAWVVVLERGLVEHPHRRRRRRTRRQHRPDPLPLRVEGRLLAATLRHAAEADILRLEKSVAASADPIARFDRALREYLPSRAATRPGCSGSTPGPRGCATRCCARSPRSSTKRGCASSKASSSRASMPARSAARTRARRRGASRRLLDGLGLQVVLHNSTMKRSQMLEHARTASAHELGLKRSEFPTTRR